MAYINLEDSFTTSCTQYSKISNQPLGIMHDYKLDQIIDRSTRTTELTHCLLDLFFTNHPDMVNKHDVTPGLSKPHPSP